MADNKIIKKIVLSDGTAADLDVKYWGGLETSAKQDTLISGTNIKTINGQSIIGEGNIDTVKEIVEVTYSELMNNIARKKLKPGQQYRIVDYVTTTTQENTISADHKFDIIVTALDESTLSEEAKAIQNNNEDYFDSCNLSAWKIWYSLDNDINRFKWASPYLLSVGYHYDSSENLHELDTWIQAIAKVLDDSTDGDFYESIDDGLDETFSHFGYTNYNGITQLTLYGRTLEDELDYRHNYHYKGIITIDGVEYDSWAQLYYSDDGSYSYATNGSGNIYILLTNRIVAESSGKGVIYRMIDEWGNDCPYDFKNIMFKRWLYEGGYGVADEDSGDFDAYCYTFSWEDSKNGIMDASIFGNNGSLLNDEGQINGVYGNIICVYNSYDGDDESPQFTKQYLNDIVFFSTYGYDGGIYYGCYSNTFSNGCYSNTFGDDCYSNTFGNGCSNNTFGDACYSNTFGDYCYSNTFGNGCHSNILGNHCGSNTFGDECYSNTFGGSCYSNTFGNGCHSNTFGISCYGNVFPIYCFHNTFDTSCSRNTVTDNMQKYNIKKGVSEKTINVEFRNSPISIDVWVTSSGELIQEPINEYITLEDIDLMWDEVFPSEGYYSGTSQDSEEIINSIGIGDYDEEKEGSDEE